MNWRGRIALRWACRPTLLIALMAAALAIASAIGFHRGSSLGLLSIGAGRDPVHASIRIDKSKYLLSLFENSRAVKTYPIVLGRNPVDDKLRKGDFCTPEGRFKIRDLYPHKLWGYFLWLDYPTSDSLQKHKAAKGAGRIPVNAEVGSQIGIHGVPAGKDELIDRRVNWTFGCISLKSADIEELYRTVRRGTPVEIVSGRTSFGGSQPPEKSIANQAPK